MGHGDPSGPHRPTPVARGGGTEKHGRLGRSGSEWRDRPDRWAQALRTGEHSMRTVLSKAAGRATLILVSAGRVGGAGVSAVPAAEGAVSHRSPGHHHVQSGVQIGEAVKYVRDADGT